MTRTHFVAESGGTDTGETLSLSTLSYSVTAITNAANAQVTTSGAHGLSVGDGIHFYSLGGMTQLNSANPGYDSRTGKNLNPTRVASVIDATNFTIDEDTSGYSTYTSGGTVYSMAAKRMNPGEVTCPAHGLENGQLIYITGVTGATIYNSTFFVVSDATTNCFRIKDTLGNYLEAATTGGYTGGGTITLYLGRVITNITQANPGVVTCPSHGFSTNDKVYFNDIGGMTELNAKGVTVTVTDANTFSIGIDTSGYTAYTSGGYVRKAWSTFNGLQSSVLFESGENVWMEKNATITQYTAANCTWTYDSHTISTSSSLVGSIAVGDYIARTNTALDGNSAGLYVVQSINATTITLYQKYAGTTGTDTASIYKYTPGTTQGSAGVACFTRRAGYSANLYGGYDFATSSKNGYSFYKHPVSKTASSSNIGLNLDSGSNITNINIATCYYCLYPYSDTTITGCTFVDGYVYTVSINLGTGVSMTDCFINSITATSWQTMLINYSVTFDNCIMIGYNNTSGGCIISSASNTVFDFDGLTCYFGGQNTFSGFNSVYKNFTSMSCQNIGMNISSSSTNRQIIDCYVDGGISGYYIGNLGVGAVVQGCTAKNCTSRGLYLGQFQGARIIGCTFEGNYRDIEADQYNGYTEIVDCSFTTPTQYSLYKPGNSGIFSVVHCEIDAPSIGKAYLLTANDVFTVPQYIFTNSFGVTGKYYGRGALILDTTTLLPNGEPSINIGFNSTVAVMYDSWIIDSIAVKAGVSQTIKFVTQANGNWSGTIIPYLYLNGTLIKTGTSITSVSNGSYDEHTISVTAGEVTEDGILTLEFNMNGNTIPINTGITEVT